MKWLALGLLASSIPLAVNAQPSPQMQDIAAPSVGEEATVAAGGELYSRARLFSIDGARLSANADWGSGIFKSVIPAGTELVSVQTKVKFKACAPIAGTFSPSSPCFLDDDGDGIFDRIAYDASTSAGKLKTPTPYERQPVYLVRQDSFKRVILYQGATADSIRFSYREFKDDLARPAFTEELVIPREPFPQRIAVKNLQVDVLAISGLGMRYRVVSVTP